MRNRRKSQGIFLHVDDWVLKGLLGRSLAGFFIHSLLPKLNSFGLSLTLQEICYGPMLDKNLMLRDKDIRHGFFEYEIFTATANFSLPR